MSGIKDYSKSGFNPYFAGAKATDMFRDSEIYGKTRSIGDLDEIGSTQFGNISNGIGNAAIATGNPYAMVGGFALKTIGGIADVFSYDPKFDGINNRYSNERRNAYDLGGIKSEIDSLNPNKVFGKAIGQMGLAGLSPIGLWGGLRAKQKAKEAKAKAQNQFVAAQDRYNTATENYFEGQAYDDVFNQRRKDRFERNIFNLQDNFYNI